jgi:hypothetical protein
VVWFAPHGDSNANARLAASAPDLYEQLKHLYRGYVNLLETARDKIVELGGPCDRLEELEVADPYLAKARAALQRAEGGSMSADVMVPDGGVCSCGDPECMHYNDVPAYWLSDQSGGSFDEMTAGQAYRKGWNDCRDAKIAARETK